MGFADRLTAAVGGRAAVGRRGSTRLGMGFADRLTAATGGRGSTRTVVVGGRGQLAAGRQLADGRQLAAKAVVAPFIAFTTASARLIEQYYLQKSCSVLLS